MNKKDKVECITKIVECIEEFKKSEDKANSFLLRFHRLYLDGSYGDLTDSINGGENIYKLHLRKLSDNLSQKSLETMGMQTFRIFVIIEFFNRDSMYTMKELTKLLEDNLKEEYTSFMNLLTENITDMKESHNL